MSKHLYLFRDRSSMATLSGGSWAGALPLNNVKDEDHGLVARSTSTALAHTKFDAVLPYPMAFREIVIGSTNTSVYARLKVTSFADAGFTTPIVTLDWSEYAGRRTPSGVLPFGHPNWFDGMEPWQDTERKHHLRVRFAATTAAQYLRFEIDDVGNAAGYLDIGRLFLPDFLAPSINYGYGQNGLGLVSASDMQRTQSGRKVFRRRVAPRIWNGAIDYLPEAEAYRDVYHFLRHNGADREIFVIPDPDSPFGDERNFFGRLVDPSPLAQVAFQQAGVGFQIEEIVG